MKVVYNKDDHGLFLTKDQMKYFVDNLYKYPELKERLNLFLHCYINLDQDFNYLGEEYILRTHPLLIETVEKFPDSSSLQIENCTGDLYYILEDGFNEYVLTPNSIKWVKNQYKNKRNVFTFLNIFHKLCGIL